MKKLLVVFLLLTAGVGGYSFRGVIQESVKSYLSPLESEPVPTLVLTRRDFDIEVLADGELTGFNTKVLMASLR